MDFLQSRKQFSQRGLEIPVCLLLDLKMPRKDGREALKEIRQNSKYNDLPIIVLSTSDSEYDKEYCNSFGISDYITKPDSFVGLLSLVDKTRQICISSHRNNNNP
jgi:CheY-like chemotaxis protein